MSHLKQVLEALRSYAAQFERERDDKGQFAKKGTGRAYGKPKNSNRKAVKKGKFTRHDKVIGRDVTSAVGRPHIQHPVVHGERGENLEKAMHELIEGGSTTGFSVAHTGSDSDVAHVLMTKPGAVGVTYGYYSRGTREENGRPNRDHIPDLRAKLHEVMGGKIQTSISKQAGHVVNDGSWDSEDHMEMVHPKGSTDADSAVERSAQHLLTVVPHESITDPAEKKRIVQQAAHIIDEHSARTGYRWAVPDTKIYGADPPNKADWVKMPVVSIPTPKGVYNILHSPTGQGEGETRTKDRETLARKFKGKRKKVWMPKEWGDFIAPLKPDAIHAASKVVHSNHEN